MKNLSESAFKFSLLIAGLALVNTASADSLWKPGISRNQATDKTARAVGDLLTVVVFEKNVINKSAKSETKKESADDAKIESFLYWIQIQNMFGKNSKTIIYMCHAFVTVFLAIKLDLSLEEFHITSIQETLVVENSH